jgi:hypothetical protein
MEIVGNSLRLLEDKINEKLVQYDEMSKTPEKDQSSLHFEYLAEIIEEVTDYRRAIVILNKFALKDLDESLLEISKKIKEIIG